MRKIHNNIKILLWCFLVVVPCFAQTTTQLNTANTESEYFYYYQGKKIFLERDNQIIALSLEGEESPARIQSTLNFSHGTLSAISEDYTRKKLNTTNEQARQRKTIKTYYTEITLSENKNKTQSDEQIATYKKMPDVIMASPCFKSSDGKKIGMSNNFYVKLKKKEDVTILYETAKKYNIEVLGSNTFMPLWFTLACGKNTTINAMQAANILYETGLFESTEPELIQHDIFSSVNDPYFVDQWGLKNTANSLIDINAEQAWAITKGSSTIKTAIIDGGFELNHPDLSPNKYPISYDASTGGSQTQVTHAHGTCVAGIVGAVQNDTGVSGVAPNSKIMSVRITSGDNIADAISWSWTNGADVINCSWGTTPSSMIDNAIANAIMYGRNQKGTVIVCAAGNSDNSASQYPGNSDNFKDFIINVGAIDKCGIRSGKTSRTGSCTPWCSEYASAYGPKLDIVAPGSAITTTDLQGDSPLYEFNPDNYTGCAFSGYSNLDYTQNFFGTSAAAPYVSGVVALVLSVNPNLTVYQVNTIIEQSAQKIRPDLYNYDTTSGRPNGTWNDKTGYGLVDAYQAVLLAQGCPTTLTVTTNVVAPNTETKQASGSIVATNIVYNGATENFKAGNFVSFEPGFIAETGSTVTAILQACSSNLMQNPPISESFVLQKENENLMEEKKTEEKPVAQKILPKEYSLSQAYPNPFNPTTTISYGLPEASYVTLKIYNTLGQEVASLVHEQKVAGYYSVEWNASSLTSGMYIYRITAGKFSESKKMQLVK